MSELVYIPPARRAPRIPRMRAQIVYGSPREVLASLAVAIATAIVVLAFWWPIFLAGAWLFRRLHHH